MRDIISSLLSIRQNPKLKILSKHPSCFTMMLSELRDNWSPDYHDFYSQVKVISEKITKLKDLDSVLSFMEGITEGTNFQIKEGFRMMFHPEVCEHVKKVLDSPDESC